MDQLPTCSLKFNSDENCRNGLNGGGSLIRDMRGKLTMAYSLVLGAGTSDWAKAASLLYGITW
ncbi:hypothetical protein KY290_012957 [Solanum tuberosum]|uniref:Uncharacterized protein n=1 Tax=Solanum tuberosum TaxID=4113 RepID=A0ABQ7VLR4_SOLTU|nr:hypothetical protein KY285_012723 [Solanum tuberosum]KAH0768976.1 hypothetical protein KY290_012957 [Solanum tuberosum]